jgi:hypothetical protein
VTSRPWRAAAYWPLHPGRVYTGHTSATTRTGLDRFIAAHRAAGCVVDVWQVQPLPGVTGGTQGAPSPAG